MKIIIAYRGIPHARGWATGDSLARAFEFLGHEVIRYGNYYCTTEWIDSKPSDIHADALIYCECNDGDPQYHELSNFTGPRIYWEFDTAMHREFTAYWLAHMKFNYIFMANALLAPEYGAIYLPYAFDNLIRNAVKHSDKKGAAIIGNPFGARLAFAIDLGIPVISNIYGEEYDRVLCSLKCHIHYHASGGSGLIVMRPFETMGLSTALLAERTAELEALFIDGRHCAMFSTIEEARTKLAAILVNDEDRILLEEQGRKEILAHHCYIHRAQTLLDALI